MPISNKSKQTGAVLLTGRSNPKLANEVAKILLTSLGKVEFIDFPNQEIKLRINEDIKNKSVYILQTFSIPVHKNIFEFLLLADACKRAGAKKITGVIPWLAYSPQDKVFRSREPLSSELIARLLKTSGVDKVITVDLHSLLNIKHLKNAGLEVQNLSAIDLFIERLKELKDHKDWVVLSLDKGALARSQRFAKSFRFPLIKMDKARDRVTGKVTFKELKKNLKGKNVISFDDFVSTGGSRIKASAMVKKLGAKKYIDCITHGLLAQDAAKKIQTSQIDKMYLTNSYPIPIEKRVGKIQIISLAPILAKIIF